MRRVGDSGCAEATTNANSARFCRDWGTSSMMSLLAAFGLDPRGEDFRDIELAACHHLDHENSQRLYVPQQSVESQVGRRRELCGLLDDVPLVERVAPSPDKLEHFTKADCPATVIVHGSEATLENLVWADEPELHPHRNHEVVQTDARRQIGQVQPEDAH